jgi:hypothetical protein
MTGVPLAVAAFAWLMSTAAWCEPLAQPVTEVAVKAAYLYKFLPYVDWPPSALPDADTPLVIGVFGADAVARELERIISGKQVNGHPVVARRIAEGETLEGLHVLFVGRGAAHQRLMERVRGRPVLVVTDSNLDAGGMLNFIPVDGRIRFEAAPAAAERAGIKLGSRLLAVAERVVSP